MKYGLPRFARNDVNKGESMKCGLLRCARNDGDGGGFMINGLLRLRLAMTGNIIRNLLTNIPLVCILILDTVGMYVTK